MTTTQTAREYEASVRAEIQQYYDVVKSGVYRTEFAIGPEFRLTVTGDGMCSYVGPEFFGSMSVMQAGQHILNGNYVYVRGLDEPEPTPQCPNAGCYNDLLPDHDECVHCQRARIQFNAAGFIVRANRYADGVCLECGAEVPFGDYCEEHGQELVPEDIRAMNARKGTTMTTTTRNDLTSDAAIEALYRKAQQEASCHYCDNTGANDDGLCPTCLAREEADAALYAPDVDAWLAEARAGWRSEDMTNGGIEPDPDDLPF